ncbi:MAG: hypothetical protein ACLPSO_06405, partial [Terracidiphilus sp.]
MVAAFGFQQTYTTVSGNPLAGHWLQDILPQAYLVGNFSFGWALGDAPDSVPARTVIAVKLCCSLFILLGQHIRRLEVLCPFLPDPGVCISTPISLQNLLFHINKYVSRTTSLVPVTRKPVSRTTMISHRKRRRGAACL